jgi:hypothetical protein
MRKCIVLLAAVLLLAALAGSAAAAGPARPPSVAGATPRGYLPPLAGPEGTVRISFEGLLHTGKALPGGAHFSAAAVRDLLITVAYHNLTLGSHTQRLHLYAPDGALYQQFATAFEVEGAGATPRAGAPPAHGLTHRDPGGAPGSEQVATRLPVGGTWITQHSLYGTWHVEVYLDQARTPAAYRALVLSQ